MADNYMAMLDMGLRQTEQVFSRIDEAVTKSFMLAEEQRQFEAQMEMKGSQFAAEMAYADKRLDQEHQKNLMLAENMKIDNELKSRAFMAEMEIKPLEIEAARINLEAAKINKQRSIQNVKESQFKALSAPWDAQVAGLVAQTNNDEIGNAYSTIVSKYMGEVAKGNSFNEAGFSEEVKSLITGFEGTPRKDGYNPAVPILLERLGATGEAARIRAANPSNPPNSVGLEIGAIMNGPEGWKSYATSSMASGIPRERVMELGSANQSYTSLTESINRTVKDIQSARSALPTRDAAGREAEQKIIDSKLQDLVRLEDERKKIFNRALGIEMPSVDNELSQDTKAIRDRLIKESAEKAKAQTDQKETAKEVNKILNVEGPVSEFDINSELLKKQRAIGDYAFNFKEAFNITDEDGSQGNINFDGLYGRSDLMKKSETYAAPIVKDILTNIEDVPLNPSKESKTSMIQLMRDESFRKIFDNLNGRAIVIGGNTIGDPTVAQNFGSFFGTNKTDDATNYSSADDVINAIRGLDNVDYMTEYEKMLKAKQLYASIVAAGAIAQMSK